MTERALDNRVLLQLGSIAWRGYREGGRGFVVLDPPRYWPRFEVPTEELVRLSADALLLTERYDPALQFVLLDLASYHAQLITPPKPPPRCRFFTVPLF